MQPTKLMEAQYALIYFGKKKKNKKILTAILLRKD